MYTAINMKSTGVATKHWSYPVTTNNDDHTRRGKITWSLRPHDVKCAYNGL